MAGLLQLNARKPNCFTAEMIRFLEGLSVSIGIALSRIQAEGALRAREETLKTQRYYLEKAQEMGHIGTWELDLRKNELRWTEENYRIFGITPGTPLTYQMFLDCVFPEDRDYVNSEWDAAVHGKPYDIQHRLLVGRQIKWVREKADLEFDENGIAVKAIGFTQDITDQKQSEKMLRESEAFTQMVLDSLPVGIAVNSVEPAQFIYMNENFPKFYRTTREALTHPDDFWTAAYEDPEFREEIKKRVLEDCNSGDPERMFWQDVPITRKGAETTFISARNTPIPNSNFMVSTVWEVTHRKKLVEEIENLARFPMENRDVVLRISEEGKVLYANPASESLLIFWDTGIGEPLPERWQERIRESQASGEVKIVEENCEGKLLSLKIVPVSGKNYVNIYGQDITDRKKMEDQLRQSQKMEAVGLLAGGIAHDFRNQLAVIQGYGEMLLRQRMVSGQTEEYIQNMLKAAERSTTLTGQLLAFSRHQELRPEVVDLNRVIEDISRSLIRVIGEDVRLHVEPNPDLGAVKIDPDQFRQAMLNLALNARDAMPKGGQLTIETSNEILNGDFVGQHQGALPGQYAMIVMSDTGTGMDKTTLEQVFEPFFTTKPVGQGTGLGLAMVYGFVKQSGGYISVYSEPGQGTTFKIYLPQVQEAPRLETELPLPTELFHGRGTILVAEDEESIRQVLVQTLRECGYTVLEASRAQEAIPLGEHYEGVIDLLISDVVMPGLSGPEIAAKITPLRPGMQVLYISGYTGKALADRGVIPRNLNLLIKPFSATVLTETVHKLLVKKRK
jgi:signal transduction histidine kinase